MEKWKCTVCSYIFSSEEVPAKCPACGAEKTMLVQSSESESQEVTSIKETDSSNDGGSVTFPDGEREWKCTICNYVHTGQEPPEKCPVCGADSSFFVEVTADGQADISEVREGEVGQKKGGEEQGGKSDLGLLGKVVIRHHLHPISVHTPNGVFPVAILFLLGAVFVGYVPLELASLFNMVVVLLSMPAVVATGYVAWSVKYKGARTYIFKVKFFCALVVAVLLTLMICWRLIEDDIALAGSTASWVYLGMGGVILAAIGIAGHLGGKLVFNK